MTNGSLRAVNSHGMAAAPDRLRQLVRARREQEEDAVGGRLLQHLQQRVGRRGREPIRLADQEDLPARLGRGPVGRLPDLLADRVDVDVPALRLHHELVRMLVAQGQPAVPARAAPAVRAQQRGGERAGGEGLAGSLRAREDVRVVRTLRRALEERDGGVLAGNLLEHGGGHAAEGTAGCRLTRRVRRARRSRARARRAPGRRPTPALRPRPPPRSAPDAPPRS